MRIHGRGRAAREGLAEGHLTDWDRRPVRPLIVHVNRRGLRRRAAVVHDCDRDADHLTFERTQRIRRRGARGEVRCGSRRRRFGPHVDRQRRDALVPARVPCHHGRPTCADVGVRVDRGRGDLLRRPRAIAEVEAVGDDPSQALVVAHARRGVEVHGLADDRMQVVRGQLGRRSPRDRGGDGEDEERDRPDHARDPGALPQGERLPPRPAHG